MTVDELQKQVEELRDAATTHAKAATDASRKCVELKAELRKARAEDNEARVVSAIESANKQIEDLRGEARFVVRETKVVLADLQAGKELIAQLRVVLPEWKEILGKVKEKAAALNKI